MQSTRFIDQLRRNRVALISLAVAITSLGYNSWRNELSEDNRTQRVVSVEVLHELADLQMLVWHIHYDKNVDARASLLTGWGIVITVRDIATVLRAPLPASAEALWKTWDGQSAKLGKSDDAEMAIRAAIEQCRKDTLALLQELR